MSSESDSESESFRYGARAQIHGPDTTPSGPDYLALPVPPACVTALPLAVVKEVLE